MFQPLAEITHGHPALKLVLSDDVAENILKRPVGHENDLQIQVPVFGDHAVEDIGQQLAPFLNRIQTRRPEKQGGVFILDEPQKLLELQFIMPFAGRRGLFGILSGRKGSSRWLKRGIRRIEDSGGAIGIDFVGQLAAQVVLHEAVTAFDNLLQKMTADGIDEMGAENTADQKITGMDSRTASYSAANSV